MYDYVVVLKELNNLFKNVVEHPVSFYVLQIDFIFVKKKIVLYKQCIVCVKILCVVNVCLIFFYLILLPL